MRIKTYAAALSLAASSVLSAQGQAPAAGNQWVSKTIDLKYLDPEELRRVFSGQSYVMQVDRNLKLLTVNGPQSFVKEVEDLAKRLDVAPALPGNIQITVFLVATGDQPACSGDLPPDLAALKGELALGTKPPTLHLLDSQFVRVRAGQPGQTGVAVASACSPSLSSLKVQSAWVNNESKEKTISLNGLQVSLNKAPKAEGDISVSIDVLPNKPAVIARSGIVSPVTLIVKAQVLP